jgi:tRNA threonylcarbamoyladenosine biosynthesis protein TsaB
MNILAFDTCFGAVSVAVRRQAASGASEVFAAYEEITIGHAERLMPMIERVMADAGMRFGDLAALAVTVGPGNFTGLRVGVAAARGLALAASLPVLGTTSLAVMAHRARAELGALHRDRPLAVVVDARREALYVQLFDATGTVARTAPALLDVGQAAEICAAHACVALGTGASLLAGAGGSKLDVALPRLQPDARSLIALAPGLAAVDHARPMYLRAPDAKPQTNKVLPRAAP